MAIIKRNLFGEIPSPLLEEYFQTLAAAGSVKIERIVSCGEGTADGKWYEQGWDEWVLLVSGKATLRFEGEPELMLLEPGDHILIPAECRHRVESTASDRNSVWLAVHFNPPC